MRNDEDEEDKDEESAHGGDENEDEDHGYGPPQTISGKTRNKFESVRINHYWIDVNLLCLSSYQLGINCQLVAGHSTLIPCESVDHSMARNLHVAVTMTRRTVMAMFHPR